MLILCIDIYVNIYTYIRPGAVVLVALRTIDANEEVRITTCKPCLYS